MGAGGDRQLRFDSPELLAAWQESGRWPAIHDAMAAMALEYLTGQVLLDLGCAYGLLGARIVAETGLRSAIGVDANKATIAAARAASVPVTLYQLRVVDQTSLDDLEGIIRRHRVDVIIARRIFPEMFGHNPDLGRAFVDMIHGAGVRELLVQGRVDTADAVNPLRSIEREVYMLNQRFDCAALRPPVAYLTAR